MHTPDDILRHILTHMEGMECVEIIDVDHFKQVNDTYGHLAGDVVLKDITAAIQSCIRSTDILIRYGGDEFLLLFPKLSKKYAGKEQKNKKAVENIVFTEYPDLPCNRQYWWCLRCASNHGSNPSGR